MKTPVMTASGTFSFGMEYSDFVDLNKIGAIGEGNPLLQGQEIKGGELLKHQQEC